MKTCAKAILVLSVGGMVLGLASQTRSVAGIESGRLADDTSGPATLSTASLSTTAYVNGTINAIDTSAGTITVTPSSGGAAEVLTFTTGTTLVSIQSVGASAIALGDRLQVVGIPTGLQAGSIMDVRLPSATSAESSSSTSAGAAASATGGAATASSTLSVTGIVTALSPPTIAVDNNISLTLSLTSGTAYSQVLPLTLSDLQTGQLVSAMAADMANGTLTALHVRVLLPAASS